MEIRDELNRCLECRGMPCSKGCPLGNKTTDFIKLAKEGKYEEAYNLLIETTCLMSICGRICPHEIQCMGSCIQGIKGNPVRIGSIEAFIGDKAIEENYPISVKEKNGKKVAVVGSGPSSLTCAFFLVRNGYDVTIYEKHNHLGGLLEHGIPEFRLDREINKKTIDRIINLGINVKYNLEFGKDFFLEDLLKEYDAVYLGIGANNSNRLNLPGEELDGVYGANELLEFGPHPDYKDKIVSVIGGGNVAMDIARTVNKMGTKKVYIIYRRSEKEMPALEIDKISSVKEGIEIIYQTNILSIKGKKKVKEIELIKTELKDLGDNRLSPVNIENTNYTFKTDYVMKALGSGVSPLVNSLNLELTSKGYVLVNNYQTSNKKVFAGGDLIGTKSTVAFAARDGREAAKAIMEYLK